jgi:multiple sugar transport system ATP-binding protein
LILAGIKLSKLHKSYGSVAILKDINLDIASGEFMVFVGPSGCGKSTLLRSICGLDTVTSGTLEIDDQVVNEVPPSKRGIAMVFQSYALYPHMSVFENISFALENQRMPRGEIKKKVEAVAEMLQLTPYLARLPKALSGGQRQRVAIGRAVVRGAKVFLFDEPLSNLDAALRVQMRMEIARLKRSLPNTTMIYVTHDQVEAMTLADRIVVLQAGRVEQVGTPMELYTAPANTFVAGFIGSPKMNLLSGDTAKAHKAKTIGVRPEHFDVSGTKGSSKTVIKGTVEYAEVLGSDSFLYVHTAEGLLTVREPGQSGFKPGSTVYINPQKEHIHRFDESGKRLS